MSRPIETTRAVSTDFPPPRARQLVEEVARELCARGATVAVSEAACGGLLSSFLVSVPGASRWFHGGTLVYSLKSRLKLSGWSQADIASYTGPSPAVALRLARNLRFELGATYVLSETGYASAATPADPPAGTAHFGVAGPAGDASWTYVSGCADRRANMQLFAERGLECLLEMIRRGPPDPEQETSEAAD
ncbi:AER101Wp [Eremothecium gossypii ATCC 10895]|uniref:AER101Wp n=1 Tax=Eremothecium gossypii (strain ATCC 10895 / CBS 109.51 / FGSC 9923 / NRRL Y-1056) TaxID=284811 RepID=Q757B2_EREGS|nr:AER101Wp [Eremothecium gossypii ATCC 10895]AAS52785.1 AER101Wp [Eremothecium gossypii ATCC 10895]AEY97091.1 FAER101Wp [Eremothecium gossypii FDAG1]